MDQIQLINKIKENPINLYDENKKRDLKIDPDEKLVNKAFEKICDDWISSEKSRKFIKHLISAFCSDDSKKVEEVTEQNEMGRCCILGIRTTSINNIVKKWEDIVEKAGDSEEKLYNLSLRLPVEIKNGTVTVKSSQSSKLLSREAWTALKEFVRRCTKEGVKEVTFIAHPFHNKHKIEKKEDYTTKAGLASFVSEEVLNKLRGLKKKK